MLIGSTQLSPVEVTGLYQAVASGGFQSPLKAIRSVLDSDNQPLQRFEYRIRQGADEQAIFLLQHALMHVSTHGSARSAKRALGELQFAGKTGTSSRQRDSWFAGYTGDLLAVVWLGSDDNADTAFTGSTGALPIWTDFMRAASRQSLLPLPPEDIVYAWVDLPTSHRSRARCASAVKLPFVAGTEPTGTLSCSQKR